GGSQEVRALAFAPDGKSFVAITAESRFTRWDMDGKLLGSVFLSDGRYLQGAVLSRDGKWAASVHENAKLHIWNVEAAALAKSFPLADRARLRTLAFSPDAKKIAIGFQIDKNNNGLGGPARTIVLEVNTGKRIGELPATFSDAQFSPSGKLLVTCDASGPIRIWNVESGKSVHTFADSAGFQQIAPAFDGVRLIGRAFYGVAAWNVHTGEKILGKRN